MRLKRLVVHGFKSFADKTEFDFDANLVGIVGPNGCGKSNVVDALKWVLGDQRAKSLRGTEMTDVIFKGAEGRSAMGEARVSIVLDDPSGKYEGRTEVSIGRRLNMDRESEYLLNDQGMRLKDVRDLLMDTGLGVGAYSVMEQGRIDAVLSANPEERRSIFEEAAGISRFKLQKREALRKLERTEQNLARVHDLIEERSKRIRGLKIQAGKARRYQELVTQLRDLKSALAVLEARVLRTDQQAVAATLHERAAALHETELARGAAQEAAALQEDEIARIGKVADEVRARIHRLESDKRSQEERADNLGERAEGFLLAAQEADERGALLATQQDERKAALASSQARIAELEAMIIALQDDLAGHRDELRERQAAARGFVEARERARELVMEQMRELTRLRNAAHDQDAEKRSLDGRRDRLAVRARGVADELDAVTRERLSHDLVADDLSGRLAALVADESAALAELAARDQEAATLARELATLRERLSAVTSQLHLLGEMAQHQEGLDDGPRFLLETRPKGLVGPLSDLLDVDVQLSPALEAALGPFVQALVVETRADADAMLQALREGKRGRAILLVLEEFDPELHKMCVLDLPEHALFLAANVRCPEHARPLVNWLLRGVCLVESLEFARKERQDLMFVTPDGTLSCGPRLEGGRSEGQGGLVVRRALRQSLEENAAGLRGELEALAARQSEAQGRVQEIKDEVKRLAEALLALRKLLGDAETQRSRLAARGGDLEREIGNVQAELSEVQAARTSTLARLGGHLLGALLAERRERAAAAAEAAAATALAEAQRLCDEAQAREQELRVRQAAAQSDRDGVAHRIRMHEEALLELARGVAEEARRKEEALAAQQKATDDAQRAREAVALLAQEASAALEERDGLDAELAAARGVLDEKKRVLVTLEARRSELGEAITQARLALAELEHKFARIDERLREETQIELLRCLGEVDGLGITCHDELGPFPPEGLGDVLLGAPLPEAMHAPERLLLRLWETPEFDAPGAATEVSSLQGQLDRLGAVNPDAVKELEQEERDFTFLEQEVKDLTDARKSLIEALRKMEAESRALFEATFEQARANFKTIFRKLFQGGHADMFLTAPKRDENVSEGAAASFDALECGIDIVAKPPGKELQSINLLSGGERSLTALAILFAVFKVKPSPFCILDEVDAALDETNVERFLRVLRDFVGPTQFCIVTHHKRTMAECQVLYGISMQRKGVSSRIAVALSQVDDLHAGNIVAEAKATEAAPTPVPEVNRLTQTVSSPLKQRIAGEEPVGF